MNNTDIRTAVTIDFAEVDTACLLFSFFLLYISFVLLPIHLFGFIRMLLGGLICDFLRPGKCSLRREWNINYKTCVRTGFFKFDAE